ncbi:formylglycine-generating enzyme family protein [Leptolyngbya cf. ectocarpi LEGE 11479]|uniref:Formylglycine-generating enzyme family protein n=1 Tax=Leptolyngbya cf. ectocarpi LEGE 11479 TaxID=1828722 RepID=A0A928WZV3_LEPEC|nr:formylglycine-generating enzyme family protein [Leptolyngbya ectocarpi]MBE9065286.1 formylglycine-generating enzyme family protein [Leptolyngbya cf. ectocarpi LEGE 11479]
MNTERFVEALGEYALNPTEIADILWLALQQPRIDVEPVPEEKDLPTADDADTETLDTSTPPADPPEEDDNGDDDEQANDKSADIASVPPGTLPREALPISVPDAGLLEETLPLVRALRPLLKQIESETVSHVDEAATVDHIAETDIWSPILECDREPWFEVALVIDGSAGMALWQRLIQDIQRLLRCYGSFRDFRVWELVFKDGQVGICALPDGSVRSPRALLSPNGCRLTLVFSDCTADYWWNGSLQPVLALWGQSMPTAIWQVLPDWMWKRTALGVGEYVAIRNRIPGATNHDLKPTYLSLRSPRLAKQSIDSTPASEAAICLPVITTEPSSIGAWSRMLSGDRRQSTPGFVLPASGWEQVSERLANDSDERLKQFRLRATPEARRLAALLSAAPVITLPVMRLIKAAMLKESSSPLPVAEVFLGGLLQRSTDQSDIDNAELVQYDFSSETRDSLLDILPPVEAIQVIDAVSEHVAERLNYTLADFRALLLSPELRAEADQYGLKTFAKVTAQILRTLGSEYAELARRLDPKPLQEPGIEKEWPDFELQNVEYEVAEFLDFPALQTLEYETVQLQLEEEPGFPPLQAKEVDVVTIVLEKPTGAIPDTEIKAFSFDVATVERKGLIRWQWEVRTEKRQAERYRERLDNDVFIKMVAIPAGSFVMGSPGDEPESSKQEGPQHDVRVKEFFMAQYPVTQAQWRFVARLPQIEWTLEAEPANFKGSNRPVERVSWYESVEFCQRLSAHTRRAYELPTEAEWEYACRAGTITPFHFGDMITTDIANYNGNRVYNDGLQGRYRAQTTHVQQFKVANAFGLYDMHGNVWEWCQDHWHTNYEGAPTDGSAWLTNNKKSKCIVRGGSWFNDPRFCRSASRNARTTDDRYNPVGFRVVCHAPRTLL